MTKRVLGFGLLALAFVLPEGGCSGTKSCADLCAERESCPDVIPSNDSCEVQCKTQDAFVKLTACEADQQTYVECLSPLESVCNADFDCATEAKHLFNCFQVYCKANATVDGCAPYTQ